MNAVLIILTACLPVAPQAAPAQYGKLSLDQLRSLRKKAAWRKRRMIFNNDGDDVIYKARVPTAEALLAARTSPLLGSQVDTIFYSNSLCFGQALHNSQVMEPFTCREAMFKPNALPGLMAKGLDPIQVMVDFCHKQGIEIFWDMRMNDTHDSNLSSYGPYLLPKLKKEHPEYLVGAANKQPPFGTWSSVDYAQPEVRDLLFRFLEEVCRKFDVDGIEMDFFRHACFFKSVAHGSKASQAELDMMTDLVRRVRAMTEHEGLRRGRPILIAIRVPDCVDYSRGIGLDVERWLADGLVDILVGTGYFRLNRWEHLVELGHKHGVSVYPCLSDSRVRGETRFHRRAIESYRGRALNAWNAGADGIYIFNYFDPRGAIWRELGDPEALHRMDKLYFVTVRNGNPGRYLRNGRHCLHTPQLTPTEPMLVPPDRPQEVEINVGDDLAQALAAGLEPSVTFHLRTSGGSDVQATLNAATLRDPIANDDWLDFAVDPTLGRRGAHRPAVLAQPG
ncbi:family 10 glycosylhydrolase, partial [PVC group bacterium]|nr:family 10 glycosylhydrolase [PVC group bacterium]